ncbi:MAG: hypothetical protein JJT94_15500 [Bernardetiaceae bacterium]|nr:hypothetical protein [Bernardetiaceae bacterium]
MSELKHILVTTFWSYKDALIQTYTLPYLKIMQGYLPEGSRIYLLTIEQKRFRMNREEAQAADKMLSQHGIINLRYPYYRFGKRSMMNWSRIISRLCTLVVRKKIAYIHSFCLTSGSAGYLISKLTGKPFVIDSYEPHAEIMTESNTWSESSFAFRFLFRMEKLESRHAKAIISCTDGMRHYALEKYGVDVSKKPFFVKPACVDLALFSPDKRKNPDLLAKFGLQDKVTCVYAGKFGGSYMEKEVFDFWKVCSGYWGQKFRVLILTIHSREEIENYCAASDLDPNIVHSQFVYHAEIPDYMGLADFAITPFKPAPSKRYGTPVKDGEYWATGLPVVITPDISDDSDIIERYDIGAIMRHFDSESYLQIAQKIDLLLQTPEQTYQKIRAVAEKYRSFEIAHRVYAQIYGE